MTNPIMLEAPAEPQAMGGNFLQQLPVILWERRWWIIITTLIGIVGAALAIFFISPTYRSNAVMLVESPQLPSDVIGAGGRDMVDRRIAAIRQQITSRPDLIQLIEQHGLYPSRRGDSMSEIVEDMRDSISLTPNEVSLAGSAGDRTIAFELAFTYPRAQQAQAVAQDLMDRVLQLDARGNAEQATNTVQFLSDQAEGLEAQIADLQSQIAAVNARNGDVLSGAGTFIAGNTGAYDSQIASLMQNNEQLRQQRNVAQTSNERDPVVVSAEQRLAAARAIYAETHPDVVMAKQNLEQARQLAEQTVQRSPVIDTIDAQIAFNNEQIARLRAAKAADSAAINSRLAAQSRAPLVQQQLGELQQRRSTLYSQYDAVQNRLLAARAGVRAEDEQMGERLSVVEPPIVPEQPSWPNRLALAAIGIGGGLGLGILLAFAVEFLFRPIRDPSSLKSMFGAAPLGVIPVVETSGAPRQRWWRRFSLAR